MLSHPVSFESSILHLEELGHSADVFSQHERGDDVDCLLQVAVQNRRDKYLSIYVVPVLVSSFLIAEQSETMA